MRKRGILYVGVVILIGIIISYIIGSRVIVILTGILVILMSMYIGRIKGSKRVYKIRVGLHRPIEWLLNIVCIWNKITYRDRVTFKFYIDDSMMKEAGEYKTNRLGGVRIDRDNYIQLGFRAIDDNRYVVNSYLLFRGDIIVGKEIMYNIRDNRVFTMNIRRQEMMSIHGLRMVVKYWVVDEQGINIVSGFYDHDGISWGLLLPYWEDNDKVVKIGVECI